MIEDTNKVITEKGYIKITKNSRGYNWETKMQEGADLEDFKKLVENIKAIDNLLADEYGGVE